MKFKKILKRVWRFIWDSDSVWSWLVNIILAFVIVKFIFYPGLGLVLGTNFPIVAVVSSSMEHSNDFDSWWEDRGKWYSDREIGKQDFLGYPFKNGFNKGDLMVLVGSDVDDIRLGQIIVFKGNARDPIIQRVVKKSMENNIYMFNTKGDNNRDSFSSIGETNIVKERIFGRAVVRIPLLGWVKIIFMELIGW